MIKRPESVKRENVNVSPNLQMRLELGLQKYPGDFEKFRPLRKTYSWSDKDFNAIQRLLQSKNIPLIYSDADFVKKGGDLSKIKPG